MDSNLNDVDTVKPRRIPADTLTPQHHDTSEFAKDLCIYQAGIDKNDLFSKADSQICSDLPDIN